MQIDSQEPPELPQRKSNSPEQIKSITGLLERHGQPCPKQHKDIVAIGSLKVGIFILPGNRETGMLESLCLQTVTNHPAMACVETFIDCLSERIEKKPASEARDHSKIYFPRNVEKAKLLAFLACLHEPTNSIGLAAQKGFWPFDHEALSDLCNFLKQLAE